MEMYKSGKCLGWLNIMKYSYLFVVLLAVSFVSASDLGYSFSRDSCECYSGVDLYDTTLQGSLLGCDYMMDVDDDFERPKISVTVWAYYNEDLVKKIKVRNQKDYDRMSELDYGIDDFFTEENKTSLIYHNSNLDDEDAERTGNFVHVYRGHKITIHAKRIPWNVKEDFEKIDECMMDAVDAFIVNEEKKAGMSDTGEENVESSIEVEHMHPFPYLTENAWLSSSDSMVGGEVRAKVLNEDGEPDSGKLVVFYIEKNDSLHGVISESHFSRFPKSTVTWRELEDNIDDVDLISYVGYGVTNKDGVAKTSYLYAKRLNMQKLSARIVALNGEVKGKIYAAVVDLKTREVESSSSVDVEFDCIAEIVRISGKGVSDLLPSGEMQGVVSGPGQVRVKRVFVEPLTYGEVKIKQKLMPGDIVNIDADSEVEIVWVNGDKIVAKLPKYVSVAEKVVYPSANIVLLSDAYSSGFASTLDKVEEIVYGMSVEKGISFLIDTVKSEIPGSEAAGLGYDFIVSIANKMEEYDAVDLSKFSIISRIRVKSQFVVNTSGDEMKISVIDGEPDIESSGGSVSLEAGERVFFGKGKMGHVEKSDEDDFAGWEIGDARVLGVEEDGWFFLGWILFFVLFFVLWLVFRTRKENNMKDKISRMIKGKRD